MNLSEAKRNYQASQDHSDLVIYLNVARRELGEKKALKIFEDISSKIIKDMYKKRLVDLDYQNYPFNRIDIYDKQSERFFRINKVIIESTIRDGKLVVGAVFLWRGDLPAMLRDIFVFDGAKVSFSDTAPIPLLALHPDHSVLILLPDEADGFDYSQDNELSDDLAEQIASYGFQYQGGHWIETFHPLTYQNIVKRAKEIYKTFL